MLAIFRFGIVYKYLSQSMLRGFTTAAACFVFTTQLRHIFGIDEITKPNQVFLKISLVTILLLFNYKHKNYLITAHYTFQTYIQILKNFNNINMAAVIISIICIVFLIIVKIFVNEKYKKQLRNIPIPSELIVVIFSLNFCIIL